MPSPLLVLLFDFLQFFNCLILILTVHITVSPTIRAPVLDIVPSHLTAPSSCFVDSAILPQPLQTSEITVQEGLAYLPVLGARMVRSDSS